MATTTVDPLFDPEILEHPHSYYATLRETDPVHRIEGTNAYLVSRSDLLHEVIANTKVYSSDSGGFLYLSESNEPGLRSPAEYPEEISGMSAVLATADPPDHGRHRKVLSGVLSTGTMNAREGEFRQIIDAALDQYLPSGRIEWMSQIAEPLPMLMVARLLGLADTTAPRLKEQGYAQLELISGFGSDELRSAWMEKAMDFGPVVDAYSAARTIDDPDQSTVIGVLAKAVTNGDLTDMEVFAILTILISAGGESTTSLLGTGVRILAERPDLQDVLRAQPDLIPTFVEEACRIDPPFRGHYRRVVTDTTLGGVKLPADSTLILMWPAANRDPEAYTQPEEIDLHRPNPRRHEIGRASCRERVYGPV